MGTSQEKSGKPQEQPNEFYKESRRQPVWHVIVLTSFTFLLYSLVWFCKNWKQLRNFAREREGEQQVWPEAQAVLERLKTCNPYLFTLLLPIPLVNMVISTRFFADIVRISPGSPESIKQHPIAFGIFITAVMSALVLGFKSLPGLFFLLFLTASLPLALVQHMLNQFWKLVEPPDLIVRQAFSVTELVTLIIGSLWLGLVVVGYMTGMSTTH